MAEDRRAEQELQRFFDLSQDMLFTAGTDGQFQKLSPAWETVLGFLPEELRGHPHIEFVHPEDRDVTLRGARELRKGNRIVEFENRFRTRTGLYRWLNWRVYFDPETALVYGVVRDVDERKRVDQMREEFISVSHELRTPLTSIRGALGLLAGGVAGDLPPQARSLLDIAASNSERLVRLINDILDIEKVESGTLGLRMESLDLAVALGQALEVNAVYARYYEVGLRLVRSESGAFVLGDPDRIQQVLANLLSNAAKFSPRGGTVEVEMVREGRRVRISVRDHGPGIPEAFRSRVFERFAQADASVARQERGTGLGLSISKAIVERHGGRIWFESEPGVQTTFSFDLPVLEPG
ncbi:MAG TPA: ATP-binding protein [Thermoanaerobaculia bacterium]|jgi:PAS domain S-box-containing protein|nr:ATP-binding protein [Thermoanaerobaculia bacterium]